MTEHIKLGQDARYPNCYDASLLQAIPRSQARNQILGQGATPFRGKDIWNAYEVSWLNAKGKPEVAIAEFLFSSESVNIIESKSFKYYLNSLNSAHFPNRFTLQQTLMQDLGRVSESEVGVCLYGVDEFTPHTMALGLCVDDLDITIDDYMPCSDKLELANGTVKNEQIYSHLLKSNCPVTGQPDWATVWIEYSGRKIDHASFLRYVVSYRAHQDFHESCVEKIFVDIQSQCLPESLSVYARYTRRGGLDINPFRTNCDRQVPFSRLARQ